MVIVYLLTGMAWAIVGFLWIFGASDIDHQYCGHNSNTYWVRNLGGIYFHEIFSDFYLQRKILRFFFYAELSKTFSDVIPNYLQTCSITNQKN